MNSKYNPMGMKTEKNQIITPEGGLFGGDLLGKLRPWGYIWSLYPRGIFDETSVLKLVKCLKFIVICV